MIELHSSTMATAVESAQPTVLNLRSELFHGLRSSDIAERSTDTMQYRCWFLFSILVERVLVFVMSMLVLDVLRVSRRMSGMLMRGILRLRLRLCGRLTGAGEATHHSNCAITNVASEVSGSMDTIGQSLQHGIWFRLVQDV